MTTNDFGAVRREVLWGGVGPVQDFTPPGGGSAKVSLPSRGRQQQRLSDRFQELEQAFAEQVQLTQSLAASDPQLVLVFEAIDEREDLEKVAALAGLEILAEAELEFEKDSDFPRKSRDKDLPVTGCLHAVCVSEKAKNEILKYWNQWQEKGRVDRGYAPLKNLFAHLKDVRPWGPQDRVRVSELATALAGMLPGTHDVEVDLWYRMSEELRSKAQLEVTALIEQAGGTVVSSAQVAAVGYHGLKCVLPLNVLQLLSTGDFDAVAAVKSSHVQYLRVTVQSRDFSGEVQTAGTPSDALPTGNPVLCVLDGVPVANHPMLAGRVSIFDPDDLASDAQTDLRKHGTAMASVCVWGDLSNGGSSATRPVLVRPILIPSLGTQNSAEELPSGVLAPDLMRRVFRELFDGVAGNPPAGESVVVLNLSVGDPASPFDGVLSAWARTLDWLSAEYGVIVVVSAGNHVGLDVPLGAGTVEALTGSARADEVNRLVAETVPRRSLLAPAESINALTVGALNSDAAGDVQLGYRLDPAPDDLIVSPLSALGSGHRRAVKPDLLAPGGRALFQRPMVTSQTQLHPAQQVANGPGIRVAASDASADVFTVGTSPAAALVSRAAAKAVDVVIGLADRSLTRSEIAAATKALIAHSARVPEDLTVYEGLGPAVSGYGAVARDFSEGCEPHEATILFLGKLGANQKRTVAFPLPDGLQQRGVKRVTATLAWMSPVNWRHRQYRRAALEFSAPSGFTSLGSATEVGGTPSKRGTLQHLIWEVDRAAGVGAGSDLSLTVTCKEQAGGLNGGTVDFAVALSLWVAPELGVDVYTQVRQQLASRIPIVPQS